MLCPNTVMEALGLDKLAEDKIMAQQCSKSTFVPFKNQVPQRPLIPPAPITTPIKHFFEFKMWACREKGICYNCDEKFTPGHRCAEKKLYLLDVYSPSALEIFDDVQDLVDDEGDIQQLPVDLPSQNDTSLPVTTFP